MTDPQPLTPEARAAVEDLLGMPGYFLVFTEGYDEPMPMVGPYRSYDAAIEGFWQSQLDAGLDPDPELTAHQHYLDSDAVRIGHVTHGPKEGTP